MIFNILQQLKYQQINSVGEFTLAEWQRYIRLFAHTANHDVAYNFLNNYNFAPPATQIPVVLFFLFQP